MPNIYRLINMESLLLINLQAAIAPAERVWLIILMIAYTVLLTYSIYFFRARRKDAESYKFKNFKDKPEKQTSAKADYARLLYRQHPDLIRNLNDANSIYKTLEKRLSHDDQLISKVEMFVDQNYADPEYNVTRLCSNLNMERSGVYRIICRHTGYSPSNFIALRRISNALKIIDSNPNLSKAELAAMTGFRSVKSFNLYFEKYAEIAQEYNRIAAEKK